jgi:type II secretory pathway pseudopilin PulG
MGLPTAAKRLGGFSLIEVIATIVVSAFVVTLLLPLIGSGLQGSRRALLRLPETYDLRSAMDGWWHRYRIEFPTNLAGLFDEIDAAATAAEGDPDAPYQIPERKWVQFDAAGLESDVLVGEEDPAEDGLRVTLGNAQGERLSAIFFPIP